VVWGLRKADAPQELPKAAPAGHTLAGAGHLKAALICSALTGMASFLYEIGWIRMLNMALGSSTHSFELMLSAFILGIALGGYFIRKRIDGLRNGLVTLGIIQFVMGILALSTIFMYGKCFQVMAWIMQALARTEAGYSVFNLSSHFVAMMIMLPATVCAGMTLPLLTSHMLKNGGGEASIGKVYAANTLGAITGVALGVQVVMPLLGLKSMILAGAAVDIAVGVWLLTLAGIPRGKRYAAALAAAGVLALSVFGSIDFDRNKMMSQVFRFGKIVSSGLEFVYHKDGKTATVDVYIHDIPDKSPAMGISTNGKPDSAVGLEEPSPDEPVMVLSSVLSWDLNPQARFVAIIGIGTGVSTHAALTIPDITRVDTIEIEHAMAEGARSFGKFSERAFSDPRSHIYYEDAKAFFTTRGDKYDLIVSEPSNPWVSGVAGLFSTEFYQVARRSLSEGGILAQWIQLYEMSPELMSSVVRAVSANFEDYAMYLASDGDLLLMARKNAPLERPGGAIFGFPETIAILERLGMKGADDLGIRYLGSGKSLDLLFRSYRLRMNSDYFPALDLGATRARFLRLSAANLRELRDNPAQAAAALEGEPARQKSLSPGANLHLTLGANALAAKAIHAAITGAGRSHSGLNPQTAADLRIVMTMGKSCPSAGETDTWLRSMNRLAFAVLPWLAVDELDEIWDMLTSNECFPRLPENARRWVSLHRAAGERDIPQAGRLAASLIPEGKFGYSSEMEYLTSLAALSMIREGRNRDVEKLLFRFTGAGEIMRSNVNLRMLLGAAASARAGSAAAK